MTRRKKHSGKEQTQNTRVYVIRISRRAGARTSVEYTTSDKRQAFREARKYAAHSLLLRFMCHHGRGNWQDLTSKVTGEVEAT